jgi:hypothetical protein
MYESMAFAAGQATRANLFLRGALDFCRKPCFHDFMSPFQALAKAIDIAGNTVKLARRLGITSQAVGQWRRAPISRVLKIEKITSVSRHLLRPDVYPPEGK